MLITKELLSEVLGIEAKDIRDRQSLVLFKYNSNPNGSVAHWSSDEWNVYELANKVKEWALTFTAYGYFLQTTVEDNNSGFCYAIECGDINVRKPKKGFRADTEPEAIFKAGQWLLDKESKHEQA